MNASVRLQRMIQRHRPQGRYQTLNRIELNATAVLHNIGIAQHLQPGKGIIPVLKANAYGHGLREMAEILNDAPCTMIAVDGYFEAARIRRITKHPILVLGYILPNNAVLLDTKRCSFVIQDEAGLHAFGRLGKPVRIHLELNTGMNRLGLQPAELASYLSVCKRYPTLQLEGVMSHLADADNEHDDSMTKQQVQLFDSLTAQILQAGYQPRYIHLAQTAGSVRAISQYANAIRLGIGLYGINPLSPDDAKVSAYADLRPVLSLKSTIIKTIELQPGDRVSYNGTFTATKAMRIGVLPLGYYEGVPRELSNQGSVLFQGRSLPIVGRICMNHTMIDLSGSSAQVYDEVTIFSDQPAQLNSVISLRDQHRLFAYTIMTGISSSIRRMIIRS